METRFRILHLLHLPDEHLPFDEPSKIVECEPLLLVDDLGQLFVGLEVVLFPQVVKELAELIIRELESQLLAALGEEHLVDGAGDHSRCNLGEHLVQLGVCPRLVAPPADRGDLAVLEIGLGEDLAVDLDDDSLQYPAAIPRFRTEGLRQSRTGPDSDQRHGERKTCDQMVSHGCRAPLRVYQHSSHSLAGAQLGQQAA